MLKFPLWYICYEYNYLKYRWGKGDGEWFCSGCHHIRVFQDNYLEWKYCGDLRCWVDNMLFSVYVAHHSILWLIGFGGTARFTFRTFSQISPWIVRNTTKFSSRYFLPPHPVVVLFWMSSSDPYWAEYWKWNHWLTQKLEKVIFDPNTLQSSLQIFVI